MKKFLRRIRGLLGVGVTWGGLWSVIGAVFGLVHGWVQPEIWTWSNPVFGWAVGMGMYGFVSGVAFGGLLSLREGRRTLADLSLRRVALWGVLGAAAVPPLFGVLGLFEVGTTVVDIVQAVFLTGFLGGTFAPTSVAIARRAELQSGSRDLLPNSDSPGLIE